MADALHRLGRRIRKIRGPESARSLGRRSGVDPRAILRFEAPKPGVRGMGLRALLRVAEVLGYEIRIEPKESGE
ncbi:MAG: hypothetical protein GY719_25670 [bacterium]|nr:hypothetical protein [bacterium]